MIEFTHNGVNFAFNLEVLSENGVPGHRITLFANGEQIGRLSPIWRDDLAMNEGSRAADVRLYLWYVAQEFNSAMDQYLQNSDPKTAVEEVWMYLKTVRVVDGKLHFDSP